ncbi:MAG: hypothetical protein KAI74_05330 [Kiritimatiellae bacterium]|nr:hypothetical protein [Kiritimatiellia bacterium]
MNTTRSRVSNKDGSALMVVLLIVIITSIILASFLSSSMGRSYMAHKLSDRVRAIAIAEAGVNEAYSILAANFDARTNDVAFPLTAYGDGTYDVTVTPISNNMAVISSAGTCGSVTEVVILDIKIDSDSDAFNNDWNSAAFDYAMICGGTFDFRGCGEIDSATNSGETVLIHSNGDMDISGDAESNVGISSSTEIAIGNNVSVDGDVTAPVLDYTTNKVTLTGTPSEESVPFVAIPDLDLTPFYNWADSHGEVVNGFTFSGTSYTPDGGILWVNGDVVIASGAVINGTIIATGNISISGAVDINAADQVFAIASRDGDITVTTSGTIVGLIYAKSGDYSYTANGTVEGQIIIAGDIKKAGTSDALLFTQSDLTPPGDDDSSTDDSNVIPSAWQQ